MACLLGLSPLAQAQSSGSHPSSKAAPPGAAPKSALTPEAKAKASYAIGMSFGATMKNQSLDSKNISIPDVERGMRDVLNGTRDFKREDAQPIQTYLMALKESLAEENHKKAAEYLAANAKKPGVKTTASGLQYKVIREGSGTPPKRTDTVTVNYTGRLLDGTEFDGTDKSGKSPVSFDVGGVIPGFTEALMLMKPGAKYQIFIPPNLAYDTRVPPGARIPSGSALVFDLELVKIEPPKPMVPPMSPMPQRPNTPHP